ncbi:MAG: S-methyl-5-thioribose-1-phosphate isomerase, partial [Desulfobacula sp.]|nr:S-methyl-5-thioribose-1-phosphate isomerase [Desulfobacula sp.]
MKVDGKDMRPIWFDMESKMVQVIDQRFLPHKLIIKDLNTVDVTIHAIKEMVVRGAPLIGATGALGVYVSLVQEKNKGADNGYLVSECRRLKAA